MPKKEGESAAHISIQPEARCEAHRQVRKQAHEEGRERAHGSSARDEVAAHVLHAERVVRVGVAAVVGGADAGAARVGDDGGIDGDLSLSVEMKIVSDELCG